MRLVRRHVALVVACALVGVALATALAMFVVTPSYAVTTKLYVSARGDTASDRLQNGEYARTHVSSYTDLVNSSDLLDAVRVQLGIRPTRSGDYADLADVITASNVVDTAVITVKVQDSSPQEALRVATAIGQVFDGVVARMEDVDGQSPVRVSVLGASSLPTSPESPSRRLFAAGGLVLGVAVGVGLSWLVETGVLARRRRAAATAEVEADSWSWEMDHVPQQQPDWDAENDEVVRPIRGSAGRQGPRAAAREEQGVATRARSAAR